MIHLRIQHICWQQTPSRESMEPSWNRFSNHRKLVWFLGYYFFIKLNFFVIFVETQLQQSIYHQICYPKHQRNSCLRKVVTIKTNGHLQQLQLQLLTNLLLLDFHLHRKQFLIKTEFPKRSRKKIMRNIKKMLHWIEKRTYTVNLKWISKKKYQRTLVQLKKDTSTSRRICCKWLLNTEYI